MTHPIELPTPYQQFIHMSRYARWRDDLGRRETWEETVDRYCEFFDEHTGRNFTDYLKGKAREYILTLKTMPSMRALMTAGEALKRENIAGYNPVVGSTRVVTREYGNVPIEELEGKSASVLNKDGKWTAASFRSYGVQPLHRVEMVLNGKSRSFTDCTENHRWVLSDGTVKATHELQPGDSIPFVSAPRPDIDYRAHSMGVSHGLVYGNDVAAAAELKILPKEEECESYLLGFMRGWIAASGSVTKKGRLSHRLSREGVDFVMKVSERLGFVVRKLYKKGDSFVVYYHRVSMEDDFLIKRNSDKVAPLSTCWKVKRVAPLGINDHVYCAEVPDTNTFTLAGGVLTGNCSYIAVNTKRSFAEALYTLMCFHPDTLVKCESGDKRIADISVGDKVLSFNEQTEEFSYKTVLAMVKTPSTDKPKVEVELESGVKVKCTADHKWLTSNRGWVEAQDLTEEDDILDPKYEVYMHTCKVSGKAYLGVTGKGTLARFNQHVYSASKTSVNGIRSSFYSAIQKYGADCWDSTILAFSYESNKAYSLEKDLIDKYATTVNGYNISKGGRGGKIGTKWSSESVEAASKNAYVRTEKHREALRKRFRENVIPKAVARIQSEENREYMRVKMLGEGNHMYGRTMTDDMKKHLSGLMEGSGNPFFGHRHSDESKLKMSIKAKENMERNGNPFLGKKHTAETREKMKAYWASRRNAAATTAPESKEVTANEG